MNLLHKAALITAFRLILPISAFAAGPAAITLGTAGNFVILSKTGVSTTGSTAITGNIGLSPAAATYITGFALTLPAAGAFSTSALVTGNVYAPGYANPTPANLTTAILDMQNAYTDGAGRAAGVTELGAGNIGGMTLSPGVYKWGTGVTIPANVILSGGAQDVWIFQIAQNLNISSATRVILAGGAQASNVFWVVAGQTTIGTTAVMNGNILDQTAIVLQTGARLNGRALAQTAVTLDANTVTMPTLTAPMPVLEPTSIPVTRSAPTSTFGQQVRTIVTNLAKGNRGGNVAALQEFLISQNKGSAALALARVGATAYFGEMTRAALAEFQASVGVSPALGNFGPITRSYIGTH